jgi:hypothetical protein
MADVLVDDADRALLEEGGWHIKPCACVQGQFYVAKDSRTWKSGVRGAGGYVKLHNVLMSPPAGMVVDHKNGNGLDNRRENLRVCTRAQNGMNRRRGKNNTSGYKGVHWCASKQRWLARISVNGKQRSLGQYTDPQQAYAAYCAAALELHGEFARLA